MRAEEACEGYIIPVPDRVPSGARAPVAAARVLGKPLGGRRLNWSVPACYVAGRYRYQSAGGIRRPVGGFFCRRMLSVTSPARRACR
ncbi:hypothetical protein BVI434_1650006 [Burkholderia vietnamiensis]|nr:hypothetical protein BVI434_1650006 [Burkholderia vietnamiensis]